MLEEVWGSEEFRVLEEGRERRHITEMWVYLVFINIFTYFLYAEDKKRARRGQWRIPESMLLLTALLGGSVGALLAMRIYRHKTRKWKFRVGIPIMIIIQIILMIYIRLLAVMYI